MAKIGPVLKKPKDKSNTTDKINTLAPKKPPILQKHSKKKITKMLKDTNSLILGKAAKEIENIQARALEKAMKDMHVKTGGKIPAHVSLSSDFTCGTPGVCVTDPKMSAPKEKSSQRDASLEKPAKKKKPIPVLDWPERKDNLYIDLPLVSENGRKPYAVVVGTLLQKIDQDMEQTSFRLKARLVINALATNIAIGKNNDEVYKEFAALVSHDVYLSNLVKRLSDSREKTLDPEDLIEEVYKYVKEHSNDGQFY